jgi:hypothetical protein
MVDTITRRINMTSSQNRRFIVCNNAKQNHVWTFVLRVVQGVLIIRAKCRRLAQG